MARTVAIRLAGLTILAWPGTLVAQVTTPPPPAQPADASGAAGNSQDQGASGQNGPNLMSPDQTSADQNRAQVPDVSQNPANPANTSIPQYPVRPGNPISPYNSSSANPQSPQLTTPSLYITGANDLNQIGTSGALSQAFGQVGSSGFFNEPILENEHPPIERIRIGPVDLKAAVVTNVVGDGNLRTGGGTTGTTGGSGGGSKSDVIYGVTPAILLEYGNHDGQKGFASLVYSPTFTRYVHHSEENTDDYQNVALNALYPFQRLTLNLTQTYTQTTGVNTDSNLRTTQTASFSMIGATYEVDDKISLSSQLQEVITSTSGANGQGTGTGGGGSGEGETISSLNNTATYRLSEKLTVGPSINVGVDKPDNTGQQTYEQGLLGVNYAPTEKIGLYLQGGAEMRQYAHAGDSVNPLFSTGIGYTPFDSTAISISATQSVHTDVDTTTGAGAALLNQTVVSTGIDAQVTQRIAQRFYLSFDFSYNHNDNQGGTGNTGGGTGSTTGDTTQDTMTYRPSFRFAPTAWSNVALYYQYESNESDVPGSTYNDNQVGLTLSAQF
jgi:hypothetical protein